MLYGFNNVLVRDGGALKACFIYAGKDGSWQLVWESTASAGLRGWQLVPQGPHQAFRAPWWSPGGSSTWMSAGRGPYLLTWCGREGPGGAALLEAGLGLCGGGRFLSEQAA